MARCASATAPRQFNGGLGISRPTKTTGERKQAMKLNIDWKGLARALVKAALPFLAGAVGGMVGGCAWGGNGPNFMF